MALIKAKHEVYGVVEVPDTYLTMWPDAYKPVDAPADELPDEGTEDSSPELDEANRD